MASKSITLPSKRMTPRVSSLKLLSWLGISIVGLNLNPIAVSAGSLTFWEAAQLVWKDAQYVWKELRGDAWEGFCHEYFYSIHCPQRRRTVGDRKVVLLPRWKYAPVLDQDGKIVFRGVETLGPEWGLCSSGRPLSPAFAARDIDYDPDDFAKRDTRGEYEIGHTNYNWEKHNEMREAVWRKTNKNRKEAEDREERERKEKKNHSAPK